MALQILEIEIMLNQGLYFFEKFIYGWIIDSVFFFVFFSQKA